MNGADSSPRKDPSAEGADRLSWTAWPLRRDPVKGLFAAIVVLGSLGGVWSWTADPLLFLVAAMVLWASVVPFFVPTRYRLSSQGVEIQRPWRSKRRPWADFRGFRSDGRLIVLSPNSKRFWLEGIRAETLLLDDNAGRVLQYVEQMVGPKDGVSPG